MKINKLLLMAAISASVVGCSDDEFASNGMNGAADGQNGKLVDAGLLGFNRGSETDTRAFDNFNKFIWMPTDLDDAGKIKNNSNQRIGFSWVGTNSKDSEYSLLQAPNANVYTNYMYEHVGWLEFGAKQPEVDPCNPYKLTNGAFIVGEGGTPEALYESTETDAISKYQYEAGRDVTPVGKYLKDGTETKLQLGSGLFKTENSAVFEGDYLVYFPYTDKFIKGQIIASHPEYFNVDVAKNIYRTLSDHSFAIGYVEGYAGGQAMSSFETKTLSGKYAIQIKDSRRNSETYTNKIKKVILYSANGIIYEQPLDAGKCVAALKSNSGIGENVYYAGDAVKTTNAVYATLINGTTEYATVENTNDGAVNIALPVLPQTISDLRIILVNDRDQTYETTAESATFTANGWTTKTIDLGAAGVEFTNTYMVVDEETLVSALGKIYLNGGTNNTIKMLKSIKLEKTMTNEYAKNEYNFIFNKNITITADEACKDVTLTVAADNGLSIKSANDNAVLTMDVPFVVEGAGCCGTNPAVVVVGGMQGKKCVVVNNKKVINNGSIALGNNLMANGVDVTYNAEFINAYDEFAVERKKTTGAAALYILGHNTVVNMETLQNEGTVTSNIDLVNLDKVFIEGSTVNGKKVIAPIEFIENSENVQQGVRAVVANIETFNNSVTENIPGSGVVAIEGYSELYVTKALTNNAAALIMTANVTEGEAHSDIDGRLTTRGTSQNDGIIDNNGVLNLEKQQMLNNGLVIDQLSGQLGGYKVINATGANTPINYAGTTYATDLNKGMYVSKVATTDRLKFALTDAVEEPSCNIIEFVGMNGNFYNLVELDPNQKLQNKDVYVDNTTVAIKAMDKENKAVARSFGHCVTVRNGHALIVKDGILSTVNNVNVEESATLRIDAKNEADASKVTIGGNLNNAGTTTHNAEILTIGEDLNNAADASFTSNQQFDVKGNVTTYGTFDSNGDNNTVGDNFTQKGGTVTFAYKTTTNVDKVFSCENGTFVRETLGNDPSYRATVNVGSLDRLDGINNGGWPTVR